MEKKLRLLILVLVSIIIAAAPVTGNQTDTMVSDVLDINGHWAEKQMTHLAGMGVVRGYPVSVYDANLGTKVPARELRPKQKITRAEFAVMMYETINLAPLGERAPFKDTAAIPAWAQTAVDTLYNQGIMMGSNGYVKPNAYITRAEIAAMVVQGLHDKTEVTSPKSFPDVHQKDWFYKPVQKAADMGIILGQTGGKFAPGSYATRGEVMTMLYNMLSYDRTEVPADSTLLAVTGDYMAKNSQAVNTGAPYDLTGLMPLLTGHEAAALSLNTDVLNEMAAQFKEIKYEVLSEGKIVNKSDWLAEVVYKTKMTLKGEETEEVINLEEHLYLMKINGSWLIYYIPSTEL